ncbi:hypothetical protein [Aeromonas veronii]|uniref:hypothetical protein n=1 Tax=Aeromonas veronii TaxID=654 RepID=UPI0027DE25B2|nr:hypothetical protein [Aeromonas veronii]WMJ06991.1 hypothetical protein RBH93_10710 [Aeromonas veronii]WMJ07000.1 hypothetical protein RBH93_10755 [Aeromonas veronii]
MALPFIVKTHHLGGGVKRLILKNELAMLIYLALALGGGANIDTGLTVAKMVTVTDYREVATDAIFSHSLAPAQGRNLGSKKHQIHRRFHQGLKKRGLENQ